MHLQRGDGVDNLVYRLLWHMDALQIPDDLGEHLLSALSSRILVFLLRLPSVRRAMHHRDDGLFLQGLGAASGEDQPVRHHQRNTRCGTRLRAAEDHPSHVGPNAITGSPSSPFQSYITLFSFNAAEWTALMTGTTHRSGRSSGLCRMRAAMRPFSWAMRNRVRAAGRAQRMSHSSTSEDASSHSPIGSSNTYTSSRSLHCFSSSLRYRGLKAEMPTYRFRSSC